MFCSLISTPWHNVDNNNKNHNKIGMCIENANKRNLENSPMPTPTPIHTQTQSESPTNPIALPNANAMVIKSVKFSSEIMALIKHLLVACLLREYNNSADGQSPCGSHSHVAGAAAFGESTFKRCGTKTKATETTEIGVANVDAAGQLKQKHQQEQVVEQQEEEGEAQLGDEFVKAVAGQPQRRGGARAAAAEYTSQRYTKRGKMATTTSETTTIAPTWLPTNVAMAAARTEMEAEILATPTATATPASTPHSHPNETQAQINKSEIFHLPKNCVLQKILHLQLLVKVGCNQTKQKKFLLPLAIISFVYFYFGFHRILYPNQIDGQSVSVNRQRFLD